MNRLVIVFEPTPDYAILEVIGRYPRMNGWFSASLGVILLAGSSERHRSNKSIKDMIAFISSSWSLADNGGKSRVRRSLLGFVMCTLFMMSCSNCQRGPVLE